MVQALLAGINQQVCTFVSASTPSWGASHSPVLVACACFSLSRRLIFLHFLEEKASVSKCKQSAHTRDGSFSMSPVSAVLGVLALRRGFLSPWRAASPCLNGPAWLSCCCQNSGPSCFLGHRGQLFFTSLFLPFSSNYGMLSYWVFLFLFSLERDNHFTHPYSLALFLFQRY